MDYPKLPKPGENLPLVSEPKAEEKVDQKQTYIPPEGTTPHYSDTKEMYVYKKILTYFKQNGIVPHGHISFDPKANKIITITNKGRQILSELATKGK